MTAISIAAIGGGIAAAAAQAQNEVVQPTATTFSWGVSGLCWVGSASVTFSAPGPATGPYAGTVTETSANVRVLRPSLSKPTTVTLSIPFTIVSGTTTIKGAITNPAPYSAAPYSSGSLGCGPSLNIIGLGATANAATYTATIQTQGQPAQTVIGTAQVNGSFDWHAFDREAAVAETLLNFPSPSS